MSNDSKARGVKATRRTMLKGLGAAAALGLADVRLARAAPSQMIMATGGGKLDEAYRQVVFTPFKERPASTSSPRATTAGA